LNQGEAAQGPYKTDLFWARIGGMRCNSADASLGNDVERDAMVEAKPWAKL